MSIHHHDVPETTPAGVVADLVAQLRDRLGEVLWSAQPDHQLIDVVQSLQVLSGVVAGVEAGAVAEADVRNLAKDKLAFGSTGDWLTHLGGLRKGEGKRRVVRPRP
jgi:hypothetical protein